MDIPSPQVLGIFITTRTIGTANRDRNKKQQTLWIQIRRRVTRRLIWVHNVWWPKACAFTNISTNLWVYGDTWQVTILSEGYQRNRNSMERDIASLANPANLIYKIYNVIAHNTLSSVQ